MIGVFFRSYDSEMEDRLRYIEAKVKKIDGKWEIFCKDSLGFSVKLENDDEN